MQRREQRGQYFVGKREIQFLRAAPDVKPSNDNLRQSERLARCRFVFGLPIVAAENDEQQQILISPRLKMQLVEKTKQN